MTWLAARRAALPDGDGFRLAPARVRLEAPWIEEVVPDAAAQPGDVDLGDDLLTPAFVDVHTHSALHAMRSRLAGDATGGHVVEDLYFRAERAMTPDDIAAFTAVGAMERLLSGTACVWEHYYAADAVIHALETVGIAGVVAPPLQDVDGPGVGRAEVNLLRTQQLAADRSLPPKGLGVALGPHAVDTVSPGLWRVVAGLARDLGLPVHAHVAQSPQEVARVAARESRTPLEALEAAGVLDAVPHAVLVHGLFLTAADLKRLDPARHTLVACLHGQARFAFPAPITRWHDAGVRWCVATDSAAANDAADVQQELRAVAYEATRPATEVEGDAAGIWAARQAARARGLDDPASLLHRVWTVPGSAHPKLPCGVIAAGHLAHLALWDLDHPAFWPGDDPLRTLALGAPQPALARLMVAGRWRGARGTWRADLVDSDAWRALRRDASARRRQVWARAGLA